MTENRPVIGITMGDPAGIGPEIVVKSLRDPAVHDTCIPLVVADAAVIEQACAITGVELTVRRVSEPTDLSDDDGVIDVLDLDNVRDLQHGRVNAAFGRAAVEAIETVCALARDGAVASIVTAPISKEAIWASGSTFPGHTEMLAHLFDVPTTQVYTMFVLDKMRIFFLTRHHPLTTAIAKLTVDSVRDGLIRTHELLQEMGIATPVVALAALNPHAGENRMLGTEESEILIPAVELARATGVNVIGPVPADAVFHQARSGRYDGVLSLYHDQGHIAAKTVDFFGTVSCTLGLPVLRTSVDHGTAFDIAGKNIADAGGQVAATRLAAELGPYVREVGRR